MDPNKEKIIEIFRENVKGKIPNVTGRNIKHDGRYGHWLEEQFGILANANNEADILGYELKNETKAKTTFGDWSANEYIYKVGEFINLFEGRTMAERKDSFCAIFGKYNEQKNRFSWSGEPAPKISSYNGFGQILVVEPNLDITARYSYSQDLRLNKSEIVPAELQEENVILAKWYGSSLPVGTSGRQKTLKEKFESKFNVQGWFTCKTDSSGAYERICFGPPISFDEWIESVRSGKVYFDSGLHQFNDRPYANWRADNAYWDSLITSEYE